MDPFHPSYPSYTSVPSPSGCGMGLNNWFVGHVDDDDEVCRALGSCICVESGRHVGASDVGRVKEKGRLQSEGWRVLCLDKCCLREEQAL